MDYKNGKFVISKGINFVFNGLNIFVKNYDILYFWRKLFSKPLEDAERYQAFTDVELIEFLLTGVTYGS
jgi:hypothetical protein